MIDLLKHFDKPVAKTIKAVFQKSYAIEAELLNATDFPPLKRPLSAFTKCINDFWGYYIEDELVGVVEIHEDDSIHIQSLVVLPDHFRKGVGRQLMQHILSQYQSSLFMVETGLENIPAIALYEHFGFSIIKEWDTDHGVRKVRMELQM